MDEDIDNSATVERNEDNEVDGANFPQYTLFDIKIDTGLKDNEGNDLPRPFTKNQMRKWLKKVKWENRKAEKRKAEKARAKERRREAREANIDLGPNRKALKKMKLEKQKRSTSIVIDLSFDHLMIEKDRFKVIKQILRCYSINRRADTPVQFHITSFGEQSKNDMSRHNGYENWDINFHEEPYLDLFPKEKIVYLTSESENVIEQFEHDTAYIIGGLVDHNQYKGLCHKIAVEQGIRHGQLPLDKYINMKTRKVLTIDHGNDDKSKSAKVEFWSIFQAEWHSHFVWHNVMAMVFEIVLRVCDGMPWQDALLKVLPMRKGAHICDNVNSSNSSIDTLCNNEVTS